MLREVELLWVALEEEKHAVQQKQLEVNSLTADLVKRDALVAAANKEIDYLSGLVRAAEAKRADDVDQYALLLREREHAVQETLSELELAATQVQRLSVALNNAEVELSRERANLREAQEEALRLKYASRLARDATDDCMRMLLDSEVAARALFVECDGLARGAFCAAWRGAVAAHQTAVSEAQRSRVDAEVALRKSNAVCSGAGRATERAMKLVVEAVAAGHAIVHAAHGDLAGLAAFASGAVAALLRWQSGAQKNRIKAWTHFGTWHSGASTVMADSFLDMTEIAFLELSSSFVRHKTSTENVFKQLQLFKQQQQGAQNESAPPPSADAALQARLVALQERFLQSQRMLQFSTRRAEEAEARLAQLEREYRSAALLQPLADASATPLPENCDEGDTSRLHAVQVLRQQLHSQAHVLGLLESSERQAACQRSAVALDSALTAVFASLCSDAAESHAQEIDRLSLSFDNEKMQLRSALVTAAEQHRRMSEQQQRLAKFLSGPAGSLEVQDNLKHRTKFLDVVLDRDMPFSSSTLADLLTDLKTEIASVMFLEMLSALTSAFVDLAPRAKTSTHLRVHVLEGALSLAEAQRDQCSMVATWIAGECEQAAQGLRALLCRTREVLVVERDDDSAAQRSAEASKTLAAQLQAEDLRLGNDAQTFRLLCDRFVSGVENLYSRLLQAEVSLGGMEATNRQREASASECLLQMDVARISQFVEREIADDALLCLREHLRLERAAGLQSIRSLVSAAEERNVWIRQLQLDVNTRAATGHCAALLAFYVEAAYNTALDHYYDLGRQCLRYVRAQATDRVTEVEFTFLVVHSEMGHALLAAHQDALDSFSDFDGICREVVETRHVLQAKLVRAGDQTMLLLQERRLERESAQYLARHVLDAGVLQTVELHAESCELLAEAMADLLRLCHAYARAAADNKRDSLRIAELELAASDLLNTVDEQKVALAASSSSAVFVQRLLEEKLAALRSAEDRINKTQDELDEARIAEKRHTEQIRLLHAKLQSESEALRQSRSREEELMSRHSNLAQLQADVARLEQAVAAEREAHRNTIRSFSLQQRTAAL